MGGDELLAPGLRPTISRIWKVNVFMDYLKRQVRTLPLLIGVAILIPLTYITGYIYGYGDCHAVLYGKPGQFMQAMHASDQGNQGSWFVPNNDPAPIYRSRSVPRPPLDNPAASASLSNAESVQNAM